MQEISAYIYAGLPDAVKHNFKFQIKSTDTTDIIMAVSETLKVPIDQIVGPSRKREIVEARQICIGLDYESQS